MCELKYPNNTFCEYIEYIHTYCLNNSITLILKGSLAEKTACEYSDIDLLLFGKINNKNITDIVYNYKNPILINISTNPKGILIITYENGISVDMDIRKTIIDKDIIPQNIILLNNGINVSDTIIRYDIDSSIYRNNYSLELLEILKLIIKGTNKYFSKNVITANDFLHEIKEKCEIYFKVKELNYNNNFMHDVKLIYKYIIIKYDLDILKQKYFNKLLGIE